MLASFGSGRLYGTRQDVANSTPIQFGVLQSVDLDFSFTTKPLFGQNQFAVFVARGEAKWTLKAKAGIISGILFNDIFYGGTRTTGQVALVTDEAATVPASSPYTIAPSKSASYSTDEGVTYAGDPGLPLQFSSSSPAAAGSYEPAASAYLFNAGDAGKAVLLNYTYTTTVGEQIALSNLQLGTTPYFSAVFRNRDPSTGLFHTLIINRLTSNKLMLGSKTSDYTLPEFDMEVLDDGTGQIGKESFGDIS